jgi:hypothetical protein
MPRQRFAHALLLTVLLLAVNFFASPRVLTAQETPTVRTPPQQQTEPPGNAPIAPGDNETERYTLSHERYAKAIAYSRATYVLYFLSVFIGFAALILALRLGIVARIRDFAERTAENRFLQGLLFIPSLALFSISSIFRFGSPGTGCPFVTNNPFSAGAPGFSTWARENCLISLSSP